MRMSCSVEGGGGGVRVVIEIMRAGSAESRTGSADGEQGVFVKRQSPPLWFRAKPSGARVVVD